MFELLAPAGHTSEVTSDNIVPTHAIEIWPQEDGWHFAILQRGTELWYARREGRLADPDGQPVTCFRGAVQTAAAALAQELSDRGLVQILGFDAVIRPDYTVRLEAPGNRKVTDARPEPDPPVEVPVLLHVDLTALVTGASAAPGRQPTSLTIAVEPGITVGVTADSTPRLISLPV